MYKVSKNLFRTMNTLFGYFLYMQYFIILIHVSEIKDFVVDVAMIM